MIDILAGFLLLLLLKCAGRSFGIVLANLTK